MAGCLAMIPATLWAQGGDEATRCLKGQGDPDQTIEHCSRAIESIPLGDEVRANCLTRRALAWFAKNKLDNASRDADAAISLNSQSSWAHNSRAVIWMQRGEADRALADYDKAIALKPDYAFALSNRGNAWLVKGDADRAIADQTAAVNLAPPQVELPLVGRGKARLAKGDLDGAAADFEAALKVNVKYANAFVGRAYVRFAQGRFDAAAEDFGYERKVRPDAENAIALYLARARNGDEQAMKGLSDMFKDVDQEQGLPAAVAMYIGRITPDQVLAAAADANPGTQRDRQCKANFQVGEWHLLKKDGETAKPYLKKAVEGCSKALMEYSAAIAELGRLK
jgi:tetratricopeptide (TPR) repeat protein